ncbi:MAG: pirin family protein [Bacteroidetes bacterium]|nr:MAG: pirin family protein [Bacteroidota bacterium]
MTTRTISHIEQSSIEFVGENRVRRALPTRNLKQVDPFLFIDYLLPVKINKGADIRIPPHPHAGFDVVTYLLNGEFFHRDSKGHEQVARAGDVNWMNAGSGIIHSEGPTGAFLEKGGHLELMQVWINLPAKDKFGESSFTHYPATQIPVVDNGDVWLKVIAGTYQGNTSPIRTDTPLFYYHIKIKAGKSFLLPVDPAYTSALYLMRGKLKSLNEEIKEGYLADYHLNGDQISFSAVEDSELILFGGEPIKEKVVSYGPFVMNSFEEIEAAFTNYQMGKMGELEY